MGIKRKKQSLLKEVNDKALYEWTSVILNAGAQLFQDSQILADRHTFSTRTIYNILKQNNFGGGIYGISYTSCCCW